MPTGERLRALGIMIVAAIIASTAALIAAVEVAARPPRDKRPVSPPK